MLLNKGGIMKETQLTQVREHLKTYGSISSWQAITTYHITRLSQFIYLLRNQGFNITDEWEGNGKTQWKRYKLVENV